MVHDKPFPLSTPVEQCQTELRERDRFFALLTRMVCVDPVDRAPVETLLTLPFPTVGAGWRIGGTGHGQRAVCGVPGSAGVVGLRRGSHV